LELRPAAAKYDQVAEPGDPYNVDEKGLSIGLGDDAAATGLGGEFPDCRGVIDTSSRGSEADAPRRVQYGTEMLKC
jgi:hypothetical protein